MSDWNHRLFLWINLNAESPAGLLVFARLCSEYLPAALVLTVLLGALLAPGPWRRLARQMLAAMALAWLGARAIQWALPLPRPFVLGLGELWIRHAPSPGFPSTHGSIALAVGLVAWFAAPTRWARLGFLLAAGLIAWSRVALGVHFPSDVLGGLALGTLVALAVLALWRWRAAERQA
jgi:undecaprenyl-diphosphatase